MDYDLSDAARAGEYLERLKVTLLELQQAYDRLLGRIQRELGDALRLPYDLAAARPEIARRVQMMQDWVTDMRLRAFILRLGDQQLPDREWLESVRSVELSLNRPVPVCAAIA